MGETTPAAPGDGLVVFRLEGEHTIVQAQHRVVAAIVAAREQGADRLLLDLGKLTGFASPSVSARQVMIRAWAVAAAGRLRIAVVVGPSIIDPEKIGVIIAANFGLVGDVFVSEAEAMDWLAL